METAEAAAEVEEAPAECVEAVEAVAEVEEAPAECVEAVEAAAEVTEAPAEAKEETPVKEEKTAKDRAFTVLGVILCLILAPILIANITMIVKSYTDSDKVPSFGGYCPFIVLTDSMVPTINGGDLVIDKVVTDAAEIQKGDIICTAVAAFMAQLDPTIEEMTDIKTAVSEAVTNCIVHAYRDTIGNITLTPILSSTKTPFPTICRKGTICASLCWGISWRRRVPSGMS